MSEDVKITTTTTHHLALSEEARRVLHYLTAQVAPKDAETWEEKSTRIIREEIHRLTAPQDAGNK